MQTSYAGIALFVKKEYDCVSHEAIQFFSASKTLHNTSSPAELSLLAFSNRNFSQ